MGCWSESCAISGLEIGAYDEALVMVLEKDDSDYEGHGPFSRYKPVTPLVWGKYSDYGDIEDVNTCDPLYFTAWLEKARRDLDPDENDHMSFMSKFYWIRKDVWEHLDNIPHEFSYGDRAKTVGESIQRLRDEANNYVTEKRKKIDNRNGKDPQSHEELIEDLMWDMQFDRNLLGLTYDHGNIASTLKNAFSNAIKDNDQDQIQNIIEAAMRVVKLNMVCYELRKIVAPSTKTGPQHGGYEAAACLSTFVLQKCQEYFSESED